VVIDEGTSSLRVLLAADLQVPPVKVPTLELALSTRAMTVPP